MRWALLIGLLACASGTVADAEVLSRSGAWYLERGAINLVVPGEGWIDFEGACIARTENGPSSLSIGFLSGDLDGYLVVDIHSETWNLRPRTHDVALVVGDQTFVLYDATLGATEINTVLVPEENPSAGWRSIASSGTPIRLVLWPEETALGEFSSRGLGAMLDAVDDCRP